MFVFQTLDHRCSEAPAAWVGRRFPAVADPVFFFRRKSSQIIGCCATRLLKRLPKLGKCGPRICFHGNNPKLPDPQRVVMVNLKTPFTQNWCPFCPVCSQEHLRGAELRRLTPTSAPLPSTKAKKRCVSVFYYEIVLQRTLRVVS